MREILVRQGEVRVPLPAREAAPERHKRHGEASAIGGQGIPRGDGAGSGGRFTPQRLPRFFQGWLYTTDGYDFRSLSMVRDQ